MDNLPCWCLVVTGFSEIGSISVASSGLSGLLTRFDTGHIILSASSGPGFRSLPRLSTATGQNSPARAFGFSTAAWARERQRFCYGDTFCFFLSARSPRDPDPCAGVGVITGNGCL